MKAPPPTGAGESAARPSAWSVRQLKAELTRLGVDSQGCVYKQDLVDLVTSHQNAAPLATDGGQAAAGRAAGAAVEPGSSGRPVPSDTDRYRYDTTMCEKCYKKRTGGHTLLKCGTCGAHYCSKECQRLDWKDHKHHCKQNHSAKALMDAAEPAELVAAFAKWMKKMRILLTRAATAALYLPTSRIATHALMLSLAHLPSMPLQFKVEAFDVWTRDKLFTLFKDDMPELPCWSLPGPDRRALVLVQMDKMLNLMPCFTDAETVADIQSGREQMEPLGRYIHFMNDRETQAVLRNNAELV